MTMNKLEKLIDGGIILGAGMFGASLASDEKYMLITGATLGTISLLASGVNIYLKYRDRVKE